MNQNQLKLDVRQWTLLAAYVFFCYLMLQIILQYVPATSDRAFLGIKQQYVDNPIFLPAFYIHVFTAVLALPAGMTQFSRYLLKNHSSIHRLNGKLYVGSIVLLAAPSGFVLGLFANGGGPSRIAFCLLGVLWFWFTLQAYRKARAGEFRQHKAYIYRSFALTLSAITLRAWKYILVGSIHPRPMDAYQWAAWLGWVPNLLIAEYLISIKPKK